MERQKKQKTYTPKEALIKAAAYCAYQERTQQEVRTKLYTYGLEPDDVEEIIVRLGQEKMLDEERYAQAYVRGKYGLKKWGRRKITQGLKAKGISDYCIKQGLKEIDYDVYEENLKQLLEKKNATEKEKNPFARRQKLTYYLVSKGYENDLVQDAIKSLGV
ncbi:MULTISPECIES: regulatory protein RecX [Pontibacter]|uniref:Regulatory protein RecX n=1 Tax=Pontibacter lucknowensis TaxID=1077936 RepID=A0A1N7B8Z1_9BACT|nr:MULTISPECIES: regulatory protein RecX [Pontibacter]EJF09598.1 regulatory protein RecX [Pontibacter sp. BAB1700]SIR47831.1 regulatory protein [Pontibacter lucknowensis]